MRRDPVTVCHPELAAVYDYVLAVICPGLPYALPRQATGDSWQPRQLVVLHLGAWRGPGASARCVLATRTVAYACLACEAGIDRGNTRIDRCQVAGIGLVRQAGIQRGQVSD